MVCRDPFFLISACASSSDSSNGRTDALRLGLASFGFGRGSREEGVVCEVSQGTDQAESDDVRGDPNFVRWNMVREEDLRGSQFPVEY